ncbi:hypothetical protein V2J09_017506 [Rumex salicifolius]
MGLVLGGDGEETGMLAYYWSLGLGSILLVLFLYKNKVDTGVSSFINVIRQRKRLRRQGINGPPPSLLQGNAPDLQRILATRQPHPHTASISHDFVPTVFPYFHQWAKEYGRVYTYTLRQKQHLYVSSPEMVRDISQNMSTNLGKATYLTNQFFPLFGNGILRANGLLWSQQRKIIAPEFHMDKLRGMMGLMREASELLVKKWGRAINITNGEGVEVRVDEDLRSFSADVIARACFGSSYVKGKHIFSKLRTLEHMLSSNGRFIFTQTNKHGKSEREREIKRLEEEVNNLIWDTVQERGQDANNVKDLMQLLLHNSSYHANDASDKKDKVNQNKSLIIDNCKNIYFAGHETTAVSAAWCLVLLASYPDWQTRLRQELLQEPHQPPTADALNRMKWLNMFIQEALRLYSPGAFVTREALQDVRLGDLTIPKGVNIWTLIPALHRDPDLWGPNALLFKPERFAGGVSNACKVPQAYIPFGLGPRNCLGKNFALLELKIILSHLLPAFTFSLSPNYHHSPTFTMVIEPSQGVYLLMDKITV